jgi:hypothetical protein
MQNNYMKKIKKIRSRIIAKWKINELFIFLHDLIKIRNKDHIQYLLFEDHRIRLNYILFKEKLFKFLLKITNPVNIKVIFVNFNYNMYNNNNKELYENLLLKR